MIGLLFFADGMPTIEVVLGKSQKSVRVLIDFNPVFDIISVFQSKFKGDIKQSAEAHRSFVSLEGGSDIQLHPKLVVIPCRIASLCLKSSSFLKL